MNSTWLGERLVVRLGRRMQGNLVSRLKGQMEDAATNEARERFERMLGRVAALTA